MDEGRIITGPRFWKLVRSTLIIFLASLALLILLDYFFVSKLIQVLNEADPDPRDPAVEQSLPAPDSPGNP